MSIYYGRIVEQAQKRVKPKQIAANLKIHVQTVYEQIRKARKIGVDIPHFAPARSVSKPTQTHKPEFETPQSGHSIVVPLRLIDLLDTEAERCSKTRAELAQSILETGLLEKWSRHG